MSILTLHTEIKRLIEKGESREQVFSRLVKKGGEHPGKYAYVVASVAKDPIAEKNLAVNVLLLCGLLIVSLLTFWTALPIDADSSTLFLFIKVLLPFFFLYFMFHFFGGIYRLAGLWFCIDLAEALFQFQHGDAVDAARVLVLFFLVVLSFYQARTLFPHLSLLQARKTEDGEYLL